MAISSMMLVPLDAAESVPAEASWPRSPPCPRPWKSCLRATLDTLLAGKLRPRALVMAEVMALVMAVWIWLLRAEMRIAPIILRKMCWGCRYKIVVIRMLLTFECRLTHLSFTTGTGLTLSWPLSTLEFSALEQEWIKRLTSSHNGSHVRWRSSWTPCPSWIPCQRAWRSCWACRCSPSPSRPWTSTLIQHRWLLVHLLWLGRL